MQSSTWPSAISDRAVDGISNSNYNAGSCSSTNFDTHPYWLVDLGRKHLIRRVEMKNRGECCPERLHDVKVTVAGHDKKFDVSCGIFKGPGIASQTVVVKCPRGIRGRYVKLQIIKGTRNILTLCEVKVIGK
ncbi:hypothetical protein FSP39_020768 [Pinctada imbricata]|uniref:Fucolectin tachylectin-4 pentraxin-1 domain-containing protein n=1 Tax=Pinctada imbricata TaxID=66713 RepID=A0AA88XX95_PINIB|nr:hypothetical protein FSP39_020768 [Pinctada imbricata]